MSKLNIDQQTIKELFTNKKQISLFQIIRDLMHGMRMNVRPCGMIFLHLHFQMTIIANLILRMTNIS